MKIMVTGGTGFLGRALLGQFAQRGDELLVVTRNPSQHPTIGLVPRLRIIEGDGTRAGRWTESIDGCDVLIHLAGSSLADVGSPGVVELLATERERSAKNLVQAVLQCQRPPRVVLAASSACVYGTRSEVVDERSGLADGLFIEPWRRAEAALALAAPKTRVVSLRFGQILGPGGLLQRVKTRDDLPTPSAAGFSWVHIRDAVSATLYAMEHTVNGAWNVTSPEPADLAAFTNALGPSLPKAKGSGFMSKLLKKGEEDSNIPWGLLSGQKVRPSAALALGYMFKHPKLGDALKNATKG